MKKIIIFLLLFCPIFASAAIDQNLYYGLLHNSQVTELQEFLISKGFMTGRATGNFYAVTWHAVKKYQTSKNIPATAYVGTMTRTAINAELSSNSGQAQNGSSSTGSTLPLTGSLALVQNSVSYPGQLSSAPQPNFKLADFSLTNNTSQAINLKKIQVDLSVGPDLYNANLYIKNLYVAFGTNKTVVLNTTSSNNYWLISSQLAKGQTINLSVYGDVNSLIPLNSVVISSVLVTGVSADTAEAVNTNSNAVLAGQSITFGTGTLTAAKDSLTPAARITVANQKIVAGKFQFTTAGNSYNISKLEFAFPNSTAISILSGAILTDTATGLLLTSSPVSAAYNGRDYILTFDVNFSIPVNSSKSVTLYYNLGNAVYLNNTGINIAPVLVYVKATNGTGTLADGAASDYYNIIASYGGIVLPSAGLAANNLYAYKSVPTFTAQSSSTSASNGTDANLYTFTIAADPNGDISIKQIMFNITITDPDKSYPSLNDFKLFKGNTDYTGSVSIGNNVNNNFEAFTRDIGLGFGTNTLVVIFEKEETILAGKSQTYTLKARTNRFLVSSTLGADSISTYIPTDTAISSGGRYLRMAFTNIYGLAQTESSVYVTKYNVLWSDKSAVAFFPHSDLNGSASGDWYNGFGILNSPLPSQTITAK